jgi:hypothetical protein
MLHRAENVLFHLINHKFLPLSLDDRLPASWQKLNDWSVTKNVAEMFG